MVAWFRAVPDEPGLPSAEELAALPHEELAVRLAGAYQVIAGLTARVEALERRAGKDSSTSSRPPSSDNPYKKKPVDRSLREKGKRAPGKHPGEPGTTMRLVDDPDTGSGTRRRSAGDAARAWRARRPSRSAAIRSLTSCPRRPQR